MATLKQIFKTIIPRKALKAFSNIRNIYFDDYASLSYSQEGEDMMLRRIFENQKLGFYVDVGAHHPFRFSNTYIFYKQGWRGINIDAMPGSMESFKNFRSRDINLEVPVGNSIDILTYYLFNEPALNGFSEELSRQRDGKNGYFITSEIKMKTSKLSSLLDKYLPKDTEIDFLSIDVEGLDFDILKSNDWGKYRPKCILVEILTSSLHEIENSEIAVFLKNYGYYVYAKAVNTVLFLRQSTH